MKTYKECRLSKWGRKIKTIRKKGRVREGDAEGRYGEADEEW